MAFNKALLERYPALEKVSPANVMEQLDELPPRERNIVLITDGGILLLLVYLILSKGLGKLHSLDGQVKATERVGGELQNASSNYREKFTQINRIRSRVRSSQGFYLASYLENEVN